MFSGRHRHDVVRDGATLGHLDRMKEVSCRILEMFFRELKKKGLPADTVSYTHLTLPTTERV